jgi:hypothetical protein
MTTAIAILIIVSTILILFLYSSRGRRRREYFDYVDLTLYSPHTTSRLTNPLDTNSVDTNYPPLSAYSDSIVSARPTYATIVTPRFDSNVHAGVIRGSAPPLRYTAATNYPITPIYHSFTR